MRKRIFAGLLATGASPVVTALVQLMSVPLLLAAWGAQKYGEWMIVWAIPGYLTFCDLGFGDASASDMVLRLARGDRAGACRTFQSSWALLCVISVLMFLIASAMIFLFPVRDFFHLSSLSVRDTRSTLLCLSSYALLTQQNGVFESGFRCEGGFAEGAFANLAVRLTESVTALIIGVATGSILATSLAYLGVRILGTAAYAFLLTRRRPWLPLGMSLANWKCIAELLKPASGFIILPGSQALISQGLPALIARSFGPISVAVFTSSKTLSRLVFQAASSIGRTIWPELSAAFGSGDIKKAKRLYHTAFKWLLLICAFSGLAMSVAGRPVYRLWTHGKLPFDNQAFQLLLASSVANSFWYMNSVVAMSQNKHRRLSLEYAFICAVGFSTALIFIPHYGLSAAAATLAGVEGCMLIRSGFRVNNTLQSDDWQPVKEPSRAA